MRGNTQFKADLSWAIEFITTKCYRSKQSKTKHDNSLEVIWAHLDA